MMDNINTGKGISSNETDILHIYFISQVVIHTSQHKAITNIRNSRTLLNKGPKYIKQ